MLKVICKKNHSFIATAIDSKTKCPECGSKFVVFEGQEPFTQGEMEVITEHYETAKWPMVVWTIIIIGAFILAVAGAVAVTKHINNLQVTQIASK